MQVRIVSSLKSMVVATVLAARIGHASPDDERAQNLLAEADALIAGGDQAAGCAKIEASLKLSDGQDTRDRLKACYQTLARALDAVKPDGTVGARVDSDARVTVSDAMKAALAICHKAHAAVLLEAKDPRACEPAEKAVAAQALPKNQAFLAGCYHATGKLGRAWRTAGKAFAAADLVTQANIKELAAIFSPGRLIVNLPAGATATIDDEPIAPSGLVIAGAAPKPDELGSIGHPLDAGPHTLKATSGTEAPFVKQVEIVDGKLETITVEWAAKKPTEPTSIPARSHKKTIGWITIAASSTVTVVGLYFGYDALRKQSDADDACPTRPKGCSMEAIELNDKVTRSANIANVSIGVGLVGAAVGAYLVLTAPKETHVVPTGGSNSIGLAITRAFD